MSRKSVHCLKGFLIWRIVSQSKSLRSWVLDLYLWCLDLYLGCLDLYCGCLDLYFGRLDLYFGCLNLYLIRVSGRADGRTRPPAGEWVGGPADGPACLQAGRPRRTDGRTGGRTDGRIRRAGGLSPLRIPKLVETIDRVFQLA